MKPAMDSAAVEEAAARWFWKRDSGDWTDADQARFDAWLHGATAHRIAYIRLKAGWKGAARMQALGAGIPAGVIPSPGAWGDRYFPGGAAYNGLAPADDRGLAGTSSSELSLPKVLPSAGTGAHPAVRNWAFAAAALLMLATGLYIHNADLLHGHQYSTPIGGLDTVPLADGSRITLNTDTRIRVELSDTERRIELDKGEAFFEVAKDPARAFVVQVNDKRVTAVGTRFSVRRVGDGARAGEIEVVVTEGRVKLEQGPPAFVPGSKAGPAVGSATALDAGAVARTSRTEVLVRQGLAPEAEQLLSWRTGFLVFEATTLADAVAEFNRYSTRKIVVADPSIAALRIGGNFRSSNTDAFLWLLQNGFPVDVQYHDNRIVLTRR